MSRTDLTGPNRLAFSPDERHLYVTNWDAKRKVVMRYDVAVDGSLAGTIKTPELPANFAWGDADGRTLYMTARSSRYRIRLGMPGIRP